RLNTSASSRSITFLFFKNLLTTEIYTLSLHDALPISPADRDGAGARRNLIRGPGPLRRNRPDRRRLCAQAYRRPRQEYRSQPLRSEEHTSELQSHLNLVCRLLLEKKKKSIHVVNIYL